MARTKSEQIISTVDFPPADLQGMPASKRGSTRFQSSTPSSKGEDNAPAKVALNSASLRVGERTSTRGWSVKSLVKLGKGKFEPVERISVRKLSAMQIVQLVRRYEETGYPLILEQWHLRADWN